MMTHKVRVQRCNRFQDISHKDQFPLPSMITNGWLLHICFLMLSVTEILSQGCSQLRSKLQQANMDNLELLGKKMGTTIPLQCVDDIINFSSKPNDVSLPSIYEFQKENATVAIDEILQQIIYVFSENHTQLPWDENSVTVFRLGLDQAIGELAPCLNTGMQDIRDKVKKYFERINVLLKDKEYSLCAWEIVQMEVRQCLIVINQLITRLSNEAPVAAAEADEMNTPGPCPASASSRVKEKQESDLPTVIDAVIQEEELNDTGT
nr:interferon beta-like [Pogona vitticeps]